MGQALTTGQWVLQIWASQLTTKASPWGFLISSHLHVSHGLEEITSPGWGESGLGISWLGLDLGRDLHPTHTPTAQLL